MNPGRPFRYEWDGTVRRLKLPPLVKLVAAYVSQYADNEGRNTRPGVERLALETQTSPATVKRALKKLRELGLLELVRSGSSMGRRAQANEYRLTIPADLLERVELVTEINVGCTDHGSPVSPDPEPADVPETPEQGSPVSRDLTEQGSVTTGTGITCEPPPDQKTTPADNTTPEDNSLTRPSLTPREADADRNPDFPIEISERHLRLVADEKPAPTTRPVVGRPRWSTRGQDVIAEAVARRAARIAAHKQQTAKEAAS